MDNKDEVKTAVEHDFEGSMFIADTDTVSGKISGFLVWDGFAGLSQTDRQKRLWDVLRKSLGAKAVQVSTIFTYTSGEYETLSAA
ncbi:MAG: hypothetical protein ABFD83_15040 [Armatimonadota bacterium]